MNIRLRTVFFLFLSLFLLWFLYIDSAILTPFILAAIFAYVFNPIVTFFSEKIRLPRTLSVVIIYAVILSTVVFFGILLTRRALSESTDLRLFIDSIVATANEQLISYLPDWLRPTAYEMLASVKATKLFSPQYLIAFFPQAISRIVSFIIFMFSGFYFLREGRTMFDKMLNFVPQEYKLDMEILLRKINSVLSAYLRGQIFLIFLVSLVLFIALSILGLRFALIVAIFSGFAEIVPLIGPIVATAAAVAVALVAGSSNFSLTPVALSAIIVVIYFVVRQVQDYFIMPHMMGKITKLHPLVILFAALTGEHLAGILGLILAVPVAASIRVLLEFSLDKINDQDIENETVN